MNYLTHPRRAVRQLRRAEPKWMRRTERTIEHPPAAAMFLGAVALAGLTALYYFGPDIVRYLKMRRM